jgi:hypothetical protein
MDLSVAVLPRLRGGHIDDFARATFNHNVSDSCPSRSKQFRRVYDEFKCSFGESQQFRSSAPHWKKGEHTSASLRTTANEHNAPVLAESRALHRVCQTCSGASRLESVFMSLIVRHDRVCVRDTIELGCRSKGK